MKKIYLLLFFTASTLTYSHSGGTDSRGGHNDRINGGYHFHHGEGPHQHPNGKCSYDKDYNSNSYAETESDSESLNSNNYKYLFWGLVPVVIFLTVNYMRKS